MISNRHIRHDFYTWLDIGTTKTVKTVCGVRSRPGLVGIPTVTLQPPVVSRGGNVFWGWCPRCCYLVYRHISSINFDAITSPAIANEYKELAFIIEPAAEFYCNQMSPPLTLTH